jgi:hypothetical protein
VGALIFRLPNLNVLKRLLGSALQLKPETIYVSAACNALTLFAGFLP